MSESTKSTNLHETLYTNSYRGFLCKTVLLVLFECDGWIKNEGYLKRNNGS